jgi:hypothetical protein
MQRKPKVEQLEVTGELLDELIDGAPAPPKLDGLVIGTLAGWTDAGEPCVRFPGSPGSEPVAARTAVPLARDAAGAEVALLFEGGDPRRPIVLGPLRRPGEAVTTASEQLPIQVDVDGERVTLTAQREIVLKVGKASITLTRAGKVLIRGAYLLSRSSGVNRIKGGSVQIN